VVNRQDENMGKIHELAIDTGDRRLVYVVLYIGTFRGMGNKLFPRFWVGRQTHRENGRNPSGLGWVVEIGVCLHVGCS